MIVLQATMRRLLFLPRRMSSWYTHLTYLGRIPKGLVAYNAAAKSPLPSCPDNKYGDHIERRVHMMNIASAQFFGFDFSVVPYSVLYVGTIPRRSCSWLHLRQWYEYIPNLSLPSCQSLWRCTRCWGLDRGRWTIYLLGFDWYIQLLFHWSG